MCIIYYIYTSNLLIIKVFLSIYTQTHCKSIYYLYMYFTKYVYMPKMYFIKYTHLQNPMAWAFGVF